MAFADLRFRNVPCKTIGLERIQEFIEDTHTKRICFAYAHQNALRSVGDQNIAGWFNLPFDDPFEAIARGVLQMDKVLFPPKSGATYYRRIDSKEEYEKIRSFVEEVRDLVFLKDCLDLSVALSMHESAPNERTVLGNHEYKVKYCANKTDVKDDMDCLIDEMQKWLEWLPYYKLADYICAIPSNKPFMRDVISGLHGFGFSDISEQVHWNNKQGSLKDVETATGKLQMVQSWDLLIDTDLSGKNVILVDDMYQSGVTMQYVAMKMKEAGAKRVFGMALVKSLSNQ